MSTRREMTNARISRIISNRLTVVLLAGFVWTTGCHTDRANFVSPAPDVLYYRARLNHRGILLSTVTPYDTVQLSVVPLNAVGDPLNDPVTGNTADATVTYTTSDRNILVSESGKISAIGPTSDVQIVAVLHYHGIAHADTAYVSATDTAPPPTLTHFALRLPAGDSARVACLIISGCDKPLEVIATDADGEAIPGVVPFVSTSNPRLLKVALPYNPVVTVNESQSVRGGVTVVASAYVYGVERRDSLRLTVNYPVAASITPGVRTTRTTTDTVLYFVPDTVVIQPGGTVTWTNPRPQRIDVVFSDSTNVEGAAGEFLALSQAIGIPLLDGGSGNINPFARDDTVQGFIAVHIRSFPKTGTYPFFSRLTGARGAVIVKAVQ